MDIVIESAHSPKRNADETINLMIKFEHLEDEVEFTASPRDPERHGRDIFSRAVLQEFGVIAPYIPPTPVEVATKENPPRRTQEMKNAFMQAQQFELLDDTEMLAQWKQHYQDLYALAQTEWWPLVEEWPVPPQEMI